MKKIAAQLKADNCTVRVEDDQGQMPLHHLAKTGASHDHPPISRDQMRSDVSPGYRALPDCLDCLGPIRTDRLILHLIAGSSVFLAEIACEWCYRPYMIAM